MIKKNAMLLILGLLLAVMIGCESYQPTRAQINWAENERDRIRKTMHGLEACIREGDIDGIMRSYVYARMPSERRQENYIGFRRLLWMPDSSGYRFVDLDRILDNLHWEYLNHGDVYFEVRVQDAQGRRWRDEFRLFRPEVNWLVAGAGLNAPKRGSVVRLGQEDVEEIASLANAVLERFGENDLDAVTGILPGTYEARFTVESRGFLGRLFMTDQRIRPFEENLLRVGALDIESWPEAADGFPARYCEDLSVFLTYDVSYSTGSRGGKFSMEIYVTENDERQWELRKIRFHGLPRP